MFPFAHTKSLISISILILTFTKNVYSNYNLDYDIEDLSEPSGFDLTEDEMVRLKLWNKGQIPYYIDAVSYDKALREKIRNYLEEVNNLGTVEFLELPTPPEDEKSRWVLFINRQGISNCPDYTNSDFSNEGVQKVILGYVCVKSNSGLAATILAILGIPPQHRSPNRDDYISVQINNVIPEKRNLFTKINNNQWLFHDLKYDFASAGHYHNHKYTVNGKSTIIPKKRVDGTIGDYNDFSETDIVKIHMLYNYISHNTNDDIMKEQCLKLFTPGRNFSIYKPQSFKKIGNQLRPMKKPVEFVEGESYVESLNKKNIQETPGDEEKNANLKEETEIAEESKLDEKPIVLGTENIRPLLAGRYAISRWYKNNIKQKLLFKKLSG